MQNKLLPQQEFIDRLASAQVLSQLQPEKIRLVAASSKQRYFDPGEFLIRHNSTDTKVFLLITGKARATMISARGREVGYQDINPGQLFGELSAIDSLPRSTSVIAVIPSVCAVISQHDFLKLLESDREISHAVMKHLTRMARDLCEKVFEFVTMSIRERVYFELIRIAQPHRGNSGEVIIHGAPTHTQIANMIGSTREAITREINVLKQDGLVKAGNNRTLIICDIAKLENLASQSIKN